MIGLVVVSLALITISFRETSGGPLHGVQNTAAAAMKPFEVAANRVARPFHDAYNWFDGLVTARNENKQLKEEVERLRQQYATAQTAQNENATLKRLLRYERGPSFPEGLQSGERERARARRARRAAAHHGFSGQEARRARQRSGRDDGRPRRPGHPRRERSRAGDAAHGRDERSRGVRPEDEGVRARPARAKHRFPARVRARVKDKVVKPGDFVVTAGTQLASLPDIYPRGILIGRVVSVYQNNVDEFKHIQVNPFADFSSLDSVAILVPLDRK